MATEKWIASVGTGKSPKDLSSDLFTTSLANNTTRAGTTTVDNDSDLDMFCDLVVELNFTSAPVAGGVVHFFILPMNDDGTPAAPTDTDQLCNLVASFILKSTSDPQRFVLRHIPVPPRDHRWGVRNESGYTIDTSANNTEVKVFYYNRQVA